MKKFIFILIILAILTNGLHFLYHCLIKNPISLYHPCPRLTKQFPTLKKLDQMLWLTPGIRWYKVKDKETGKEYLFNMEWDYDKKIDVMRIMDYETRDKWINITRGEYFRRFDQPTNYMGFKDFENAMKGEILRKK